MSAIDDIKDKLAALDKELEKPDEGAELRALSGELELKLELKATRAIAAMNDALNTRDGWERPAGFIFGNGSRVNAIWYRQFRAAEIKLIGEASLKGQGEAERVQREVTRNCILAFYPHDTPPPSASDTGAAEKWVDAWVNSRLVAYPTLWDELLAGINVHTAARRDTLRGKV